MRINLTIWSFFISVMAKAQSFVPPPPNDLDNYDTKDLPPIDQTWLLIGLCITGIMIGTVYYNRFYKTETIK